MPRPAESGAAAVVLHQNFPPELKNLNQWCLWQENKIPLSPTGTEIKTNDPSTWSTFSECIMENSLSLDYCGVGFVFAQGGGIVGIDLDDCFNADGSLKQWGAKVLKLCSAGYIERSPSGRGLHILVKGKKPGRRCRKPVENKKGGKIGEIEIYEQERYFTMTGHLYDPQYNKLVRDQKFIDELYAGLFGEEKKPAQPEASKAEIQTEAGPEVLEKSKSADHEAILTLILSSAQADKFRQLYSGEIKTTLALYGNDHSRAVHALSGIVSWYTGDAAVMTEIFKASALFAGKWASGKWERVGIEAFNKQREGHGSNIYSTDEPERAAPEDEFLTDSERAAKERDKGQKEYELHIALLHERGDTRRDILSDALHFKENGLWKPVFTGPLIKALRGECQARGRKYKKTHIENYLYMYESELKPELLLDLPAWDGEDRIAYMCSRLNLFEVSAESFTDLFKDWCARLWARLDLPHLIQNRAVLLSGEQGTGKDFWIKSIFYALGPYLSDLVLDGKWAKESDISVVMARSLVLFISEFEKTEQINVGTLKELITKENFTMVRKYDRDATVLKNRCSVIGACNPTHIFKDVTGNRRFLYFRLEGGPGTAIKWDYPVMDLGWSNMCLSQIAELAKEKYRADTMSEERMREIQREYTPQDPYIDLIADFEAEIEAQASKDNWTNNHGIFRLGEIDKTLASLGRNYEIRRGQLLQVLKQRGCTYRTKNCTWYGTREACRAGAATVQERINPGAAQSTFDDF